MKKCLKTKLQTIIILLLIAIFLVLAYGMIRDKKTQTILSKQSQAYAKKQLEQEQRLERRKIFKGMKISTFGDSITAQHQWQQYVVNELGVTEYVNLGVGGTTVSGSSPTAMWQDARINKIPTDSNVIIFMGGTNDWGGNIPLGSVNSQNTNTFYGALNIIADKLATNFPKAKIIFLSTTFVKYTNSNFNDKNGIVNNLGLKNIDYGMSIKRIADAKHISFVDLTSLWDETNIANYVAKENNSFIHPNVNGGQKMAETIVNTLRKQAGVQ